jgi:hypothetical protein
VIWAVYGEKNAGVFDKLWYIVDISFHPLKKKYLDLGK